MKVILRLPTLDQYGYMEAEVEVNSIEDALVEYSKAIRLIKGGEGLSDKEFNEFVDNQLLGNNKNHVDQYEKASADQKAVIQILKRALKRINNKQ